MDLCSLVALDMSHYKCRFPRVLDLYTDRSGSCYSLFRQYPYLPTTLISIVAWSLSGIFAVDSLFRR